jgi:hypothetical protein
MFANIQMERGESVILLAAVILKIAVFVDMTASNMEDGHRQLARNCCL